MALDNFRKVNITLNKANQRVLETQIAKVGDTNGRELVVQITNNGIIEDQTGTTLKLNWQHENGKQGSTNFNVVDIKTGKFSVYYPKEMLYKGKVNASIEITSNGQITNSMNFKIIVQADVFDGEAGNVDGVFITLAEVNKKLDDREAEYVELKNRQTSIETQFNTIQQDLTDIDVNSAPEIIAARNGFDTLNERLTTSEQEINQKISHMASVNVKDFGAKGDGVTNDTDAFYNASLALMDAGGGELNIPQGTYIVGKQTFTGDTSDNYAYAPNPIIEIKNMENQVIINGNGSVLKAADGMRFGAFDNVTGEPIVTTGRFINRPNKADMYDAMIFVENNKSVVIKDLELFGNIDTLILGGNYGDVGYQCLATGLKSRKNKSVTIENVHSHHHALDGMAITYTNMTESDKKNPHTLINVIVEYNARQGLSWTGGKGLTALSCKFNHSGRGRFYSAPAAGLDIEAESSIIRDGLFINCEFGGNYSQGLVASSGDSENVTFLKCVFAGTVGQSIWAKKPKFKFIDCTISGTAVNVYTSTNEEDRTLFRDCVFTADYVFEGEQPFGTRLAEFSGQNPIFENTTFITNNTEISLQLTSATATYRNCSMVQNGFTGTASPRGLFEGTNKITANTGTVVLAGSVNQGSLDVTGNVSGVVNVNGQVVSKSPTFDRMTIVGNFNSIERKESKLGTHYTRPGTGTWVKGDIVFNNEPTAGAPFGWVCVESGNPGTWVNLPNL